MPLLAENVNPWVTKCSDLFSIQFGLFAFHEATWANSGILTDRFENRNIEFRSTYTKLAPKNFEEERLPVFRLSRAHMSVGKNPSSSFVYKEARARMCASFILKKSIFNGGFNPYRKILCLAKNISILQPV